MIGIIHSISLVFQNTECLFVRWKKNNVKYKINGYTIYKI